MAEQEGKLTVDDEMREAGEQHQRRQDEATATLERADSEEEEEEGAGERKLEEPEYLQARYNKLQAEAEALRRKLMELNAEEEKVDKEGYNGDKEEGKDTDAVGCVGDEGDPSATENGSDEAKPEAHEKVNNANADGSNEEPLHPRGGGGHETFNY